MAGGAFWCNQRIVSEEIFIENWTGDFETL